MNALALADARIASRSMSPSRLARAYAVETYYECLRMLRAPAFAIPFLVLPVAIYLLFGVAMASAAIAKNPQVANYLFVGFTSMAVMGPAMFGMGVTLATEREGGLLRLKRALPLPPGAYLLSKLLMAVFFAIVAAVIMVITASLVGHLTLSPLRLLAVCAVLVAGSLPFCSLGLLVGTFVGGGAAPAVLNLIYLPMIWLSGLFVPLPAFLQKWSVIWPAFHLGQLGVAAGDIPGFTFFPPQASAGILVAMTLVCTAAAVRRLARIG